MIVFQRRVAPVLGALMAIVTVASLAVAIDLRRGDGALLERAALIPSRVWQGELWRLVTWAPIALGPWSLVSLLVAIYACGGELLAGWGDRRLLRFVGGVLALASVGTCALAPVLGAGDGGYLGGLALADALVIAWGLVHPARQVRVYVFLVVTGEQLAYGTLGFTALCALYFGVAAVLPPLIAGGAAYAFVRQRPRRTRMHVVDGGRPTRGPFAPN